jgi:hypothetical protein
MKRISDRPVGLWSSLAANRAQEFGMVSNFLGVGYGCGCRFLELICLFSASH